ncbi:MAG: hypothetical protein HY319_06755 [Armatimonadetes bacterium]|nr:hypothetical protein [Armatimonadota bacterium]
MRFRGGLPERRTARTRGALLLEQVISIGLLGAMLLMVAAATIQTGRGGRAAQRSYQGRVVAQNLLETQQSGSVSLLSIGVLPPIEDQFSDGTPYTATVEIYGLGGVGAASGLSDDDIKGLRVTVVWSDVNGSHQARCEGLLARLPR